jgi:MFS transporter, ACS family, tartrate transporter
LFMVAVPVCTMIGYPLSSELMRLDGQLGLHGWQWLLVIEGLPATLLGFACLVLLPDGPRQVKWLSARERDWLLATLAAERADVARRGHSSLRDALAQPLVWILALIYFGIVLALYGLGFWLPTLISGFGVGLTQVGWLSAVPFGFAAAFMVWWGHRSDAKQERIWHAAISIAVGFAGFAVASQVESITAQVLCLCFAAVGIYGAIPVFWTLPSLYLSGTAAAAGIALINSLGNLAGYLSPQLVAWVTGESGDFSAALLLLGCAMLLSGGLLVLIRGRLSPAR